MAQILVAVESFAPGFGGTAEIPVIAGVKYNVSVRGTDMFGSGGSDVTYSPAEDVAVTPSAVRKRLMLPWLRIIPQFRCLSRIRMEIR